MRYNINNTSLKTSQRNQRVNCCGSYCCLGEGARCFLFAVVTVLIRLLFLLGIITEQTVAFTRLRRRLEVYLPILKNSERSTIDKMGTFPCEKEGKEDSIIEIIEKYFSKIPLARSTNLLNNSKKPPSISQYVKANLPKLELSKFG